MREVMRAYLNGGVLPSRRDLGRKGTGPTDESVGYCRASLAGLGVGYVALTELEVFGGGRRKQMERTHVRCYSVRELVR